MQWKAGYPIGGSPSEPATMVDSQKEIYQCHISRGHQESKGWKLVGLKFTELVTGATHVDDTAIYSKIYCEVCLETKIRDTFPSYVGVSTEESGRVIRFLNVSISSIMGWKNLSSCRIIPTYRLLLVISPIKKSPDWESLLELALTIFICSFSSS